MSSTRPDATPAGRWRVPPLLKSPLLGLVCVTLSTIATFAAFDFFFPASLPAAMRGKWVVVEGEGLHGATLEFFADGSMVGTIRTEGKEVAIKGRVQVEGNRFRVTTPGPNGGMEVTDSEEILELTDGRFVVQDARGELIIMERPATTSAAKVPTAGGAR